MKRVYFVRRSDGTGPIKIGVSDNLERRLLQLSWNVKSDLVILAEAPGGFRDEGRLHRQFAEHCVEGEWFSPDQSVLDAIAFVKRRGKLPPTPPSDRDVVLARRYLGGETLEQIAVDHGISRERVRQILRKAGVPSLGLRAEHIRRAAPVTRDERKVASLYLSGMTKTELEQAYPDVCIASALRRAGAVGKRAICQEKARLRALAVAFDYNNGLGAQAIADKFGFAHKTHVYRFLRDAGVPAQRRGGCNRGVLEQKHLKIVDAFNRGESFEDIAVEFGASVAGIRQLIARHSNIVAPEALERRRALGEQRRLAAVIRANHLRARSKVAA